MNRTAATGRRTVATAPKTDALGVPAWVAEVLRADGAGAREWRSAVGDRVCRVSAATGPRVSLVTVCLPAATTLDGESLRGATRAAYALIRRTLAMTAAPHPVRMWNYIPAIHEPVADELDRYQVFNLGRYEAFCDWFGGAARFPRALPTATGIGHDGDDLVIHALGAAAPGRSLENPRQHPAFCYSSRYGPRPPCFARATVASIPHMGERMLIGGTASVRGEDSVHDGDLEGQLGELFENLSALLRTPGNGSAPLAYVRDARVYYRREADAAKVAAAVAGCFPDEARIEMVRADICRTELLVEIEAVADVPAGLNP